MRVTDYIANFIYEQGVDRIFMVSGGGMMFLSDGIASHPELEAVCNHHEQASTMAAVSYAKYNGNFGVAYLTTGCGGTNGLTGLLNAWQDNVPCLIVSGQSKRKETVRNSGLPLRQLGVQEADIISVVQSLTKYAVMVNNPEEIRYHLGKAVYLARSGRPGPVWIDVPLDVQAAEIDPARLRVFKPDELTADYKLEPTSKELNRFYELIESSRRPVVIAGQGIRLSRSIQLFRGFIEKANIPVVASRLGINILPSDHPLFIGRIGNKGDRAGNFAVQNSDLVISIGSRLSVSSTGHEYKLFAREAKVVAIDIDPNEHRKNTVKIDFIINADIKCFFSCLKEIPATPIESWVMKCREWKKKWPVCLPEYSDDSNGINLYYFVDVLSGRMKEHDVVVSDAGSSFYVVSQGIMLKEDQRYITSGGQAEMGYTLPACIGISFVPHKGQVIGITGDGSFQMNIQELQTLKHYSIPVKLFVWNNDGYLSIRATQSKFFDGRYIGTDDKSGVSFPDTKKIAEAYGLKYYKADKAGDLGAVIGKVLDENCPVICEVMCIRDQEIVPSVSSVRIKDGTMVSKPLEDMYPFLGREEFYKNMIVKPVS